MKSVRLVIEHGNHTNQPDRTIIFTPGFAEKCAAAAVSAVKAVYGGTTPQPPASVPTVPWSETDVGPKTMHDGSPALAWLIELTADRDVPVRATASRSGPVLKTIKKNQKVKGRGSMRNKSGPFVFPDLGELGVGRAAWSAWKEKPPKP